MNTQIEERADFGEIRYANCWEDADVLCEALKPAPGKRFLSIASGGDNAFALVAEGAQVVAADISNAQLAVVELKRAAVKHLTYRETIAFLGVTDNDDRLQVYDGLQHELTDNARAFWRSHQQQIAQGIIHAGKFEQYFHLFRRFVLPLIHSRKTVKALLKPREVPRREHFYHTRWSTWRWRLLFKIFFSRFTMGRLGRDPEFFRYVEGSVADKILARAEYALTALPTHTNPYLTYIINGNFGPPLPRYLRPEAFDPLKQNLQALTLLQGPIQQAATRDGGQFNGFNLSDIFEYLDPQTCRQLYMELLETAAPHARFAYWNMLAPRTCPPELRNVVKPMPDLAKQLFAKDKAFFYSAFVVEEHTG